MANVFVSVCTLLCYRKKLFTAYYEKLIAYKINSVFPKMFFLTNNPLRKICPYSELFWSAFFPHFPEFGRNTERYPHSDWIQRNTPYVNTKRYPHLDRIRRDTPYLSVFSPNSGKCGKNADQNNSEYGHFFTQWTST